MNYKQSTLALAIVTLLSGCGAEDNKDISGKDNNIYAPIVKGEVTIPALHVGSTVRGVYQYFDPNPASRLEGASQYLWREADGTELGTQQELTLTNDEFGNQIQYCVTPVAEGTVNTIGDLTCSILKTVEASLGEPPVATDVEIDDNAPTVGDTINGSYVYSHPEEIAEGSTTLSWYADDSKIDGQDGQSLDLLPHQTEGKAVKFCVTPETNQNIPVVGEEKCSLPTTPVAVKLGSAPEAQNVTVTGQPYVGAVITGDYDYFDADGDHEGASEFTWKRDAAEIPGVTSKTYKATLDDDGSTLSFCVKPVSLTGSPTEAVTPNCTQMDTAISVLVEQAPVASDVQANIKSGGIAEVGEVLISQYTYTQGEQAPEGDSQGVWKIGGTEQSCSTASGCEYPLTLAELGKTVEFCVTPYTELGTPGNEACSVIVNPMGIKLEGVLEYDKQVIATVFEYDGDVTTNGHWMVDTTNQDGPAGDTNPSSQGTGTNYIIGVRAAVADGNGNGVVDDYDWVPAGETVDARNFVGKSLQFCLDTTSYGQKCVSAADYPEVTGGLFYDASDVTKRAVEPIRQVIFNSSHTYHRPLTVAEAKLKDAAGFGANIPDATAPLSLHGVDWALFGQIIGAEKPALTSCRNLYADSGEWHLPQSQFSATKYVPNYYAADGNTPPTASANSMIKLTKELISNVATDLDLSPVFGWPVGMTDKIPYGSASRLSADTQNYNVVRYYSNGGTANNYTEEQAPLISCVKPAN